MNIPVVAGGICGLCSAIVVALDKRWVMEKIEGNLTLTLHSYIISPLFFAPFFLFPWFDIGIPTGEQLFLISLTSLGKIVPKLLYFRGLRVEDASIMSMLMRLVSPFTVLVTALLLGQYLSQITYFGVILVTIGAMMASVDLDDLRNRDLSIGVLYALLAAFGFAFVNAGIDYTLARISLWRFFVWSYLVGFLPALALAWSRDSSRRDYRRALTTLDSGIARLTLVKVIFMIGVFVFYYGSTQGPIGVVATVAAIEPLLIIFLIGAWIRLTGRPRELEPRETVLRVTAAVMVIFGVYLL